MIRGPDVRRASLRMVLALVRALYRATARSGLQMKPETVTVLVETEFFPFK
jgi:hypothetical protein